MKQFTNLKCKSLHTFHSEKIGVLFYYICSMDIEGRTIHFLIHFDCDDLYDSRAEGHDCWDDEDLENFVNDLALSSAEVLASNKDINEIIDMADATIEEYNEGAYLPIETNQ